MEDYVQCKIRVVIFVMHTPVSVFYRYFFNETFLTL